MIVPNVSVRESTSPLDPVDGLFVGLPTHGQSCPSVRRDPPIRQQRREVVVRGRIARLCRTRGHVLQVRPRLDLVQLGAADQ
jgi:hypothetical protein